MWTNPRHRELTGLELPRWVMTEVTPTGETLATLVRKSRAFTQRRRPGLPGRGVFGRNRGHRPDSLLQLPAPPVRYIQHLQVRLPAELYERLREGAERDQKPATNLLIGIIEEAVRRRGMPSASLPFFDHGPRWRTPPRPRAHTV